MKLVKFIQDNFELDEIPDGLHVIGTCGECKHWRPKAHDLGKCRDRVGNWWKSDGCIDFEQKEGS